MNIFHQIALNKEWTLFEYYSNNYYQQPDISGMTPFMIFFERAPINFILEYITDYPSQLKQAIEYSTSQGKNIAHCLSMNKDISEDNESIIMNILSQLPSCGSEDQMLKLLLLQPYNDFIPLVFYLDSHKVVLNSVCQFLSQFITKKFDVNKLHIQANQKIRIEKILNKMKTMCIQVCMRGSIIFKRTVKLQQNNTIKNHLLYMIMFTQNTFNW